MQFTYEAYHGLLELLKYEGYEFSGYKNWEDKEKAVILRHDIDTDISRAVKIAELEARENVSSTYFVLISSDFYNVFSKKSYEMLNQIIKYGHTIGLHFDEEKYTDSAGNFEALSNNIREEANILGEALGQKIDIVSMHRPSNGLLEADIAIEGMINSYNHTFFKDFKYVSDSRRRWREPVESIIKSKKYDRLHILTHAFWYEECEGDIHNTVMNYINNGNSYRYDILESNITDLQSIMRRDEIR